MTDGNRGILIGVFSYNEKANLERTVNGLVVQLPQEGGKIVIFDDSDDGVTLELAEGLQRQYGSLVELHHAPRAGKVPRENELARMFLESSYRILLHFDSDLVIPPTCLAKLVERIDEGYDLVSAVSLSLPHRTLFERAVRALQRIWEARRLTPGYEVTTIGHSGVYSRTAVKAIYPIPLGGYSEDFHTLNAARLAGLKVGVAPDAHVYFRVPSTLDDYVDGVRRLRRQEAKSIARYGPGIKTILEELYRPDPKAVAMAIRLDPLGFLLAPYVLVVREAARLSQGSTSTDSWNSLKSTKETI